ncbi:hypothetical protein F2P81_001209 [Scophthalmus maximus]|uniref:K Homology domain-containing protein n=1 Tax=Scophthalmus maximus TaxID=52904 RepID=A0A6A4TJ68_SCOMX|nr:hypothetical protein F2P81_001209 [Scophthalmus maximus]
MYPVPEIEKLQKDEGKEEEKFIDVVINKNMKLGQKVLIPVKQFPKFNFVGKLLGPRGNSLKRLQEDTLTKMSILGKGSMRDKEKEEELRQSGEAKYHHLNEDLHVLIEVFAPPAEAYARMGHALEEIKKFLIPEYDDGYGTAYDDQGYESYDNNYSNQGQNSDDYYEYGHSGESYDSYGEGQSPRCESPVCVRVLRRLFCHREARRFIPDTSTCADTTVCRIVFTCTFA